MSDTPPRRKVTYKTLLKKMEKGEPITQLAAYDIVQPLWRIVWAWTFSAFQTQVV